MMTVFSRLLPITRRKEAKKSATASEAQADEAREKLQRRRDMLRKTIERAKSDANNDR